MTERPSTYNSPRANKMDRMLRILASPQRRELLHHLLQNTDKSFALEEMIQLIKSGDLDRETLEIQLHHWHLPSLDDTPYVDYDDRSGTVRPRPAIAELEPLLEMFEELETEFEEG